ncbi:fatty acid desaturase CarF family protein [Roseiconus lacunae]|uniref:fatty acid desaturase CarF family protein n=1 Tax=Roseiconus lacunae TaxID=2605694 RepID=UPI0011F21451|nr:fatty acid desaturase CarF family protein [Roseiconus lacunae]
MIWIQILAAWLLADFITGVFHWFEDRYLDDTQSLEFARGLATDNQLHHERPTAMLLSTHWQNMRSAAIVAWPLAMLAWSMGAPVWFWLGLAFAAFGNLVHRFAHEPRRKLPRWIRGLQEFGLFISREHHDSHHREMGRLIPKSRAAIAYCPMTDWVNPLLDRVQF